MRPESDTESEPVIIVDLSLGGFQIRSKRTFHNGELCEISISDPDNDPLVVQAEVRYASEIPEVGLYGTGFRFHPATLEQKVALVNYIHTRFRMDVERLTAEVGSSF